MNVDLAFFCGTLPLVLAAAFSDLRTMTIPNWISIALIAVFLGLGLVFLPLETVGWRLLAAFVVLVVLFFVNAAGIMGGGDAKLLAACTPFIAHEDVSLALLILAAAMLITLLLHRIARATPLIRRVTDGWQSWEAGRNFPMGTSIVSALIVYLFLKI